MPTIMKTGTYGTVVRRVLHSAPLLLLAMLLTSCYSFKGGSAPAHLQTIVIPQVEDVSGFGRSTIRQDMTVELIQKFRDDNSLRVLDISETDSRLDVTITAIRNNERLAVSASERETVRGVIIQARVTFYDNIKRRPIYRDKTFQGTSSYNISQGVAGENEAILVALDELTTNILLETVANW